MQKPTFSLAAMTQIAVVAALYAALTICLAPLSYGVVQVRVAEVLMLLCLYRGRWCVALTIGCAIANLFSGMMLDCLFGTLATLLAAVWMRNTHSKGVPFLPSLIPALLNGVVVGVELSLSASLPFWTTFLSVAAGEVVAITVIGLPLWRLAMRSRPLRRLIGVPDADCHAPCCTD